MRHSFSPLKLARSCLVTPLPYAGDGLRHRGSSALLRGGPQHLSRQQSANRDPELQKAALASVYPKK